VAAPLCLQRWQRATENARNEKARQSKMYARVHNERLEFAAPKVVHFPTLQRRNCGIASGCQLREGRMKVS